MRRQGADEQATRAAVQRSDVSTDGFDALSVARELEGTGIERGQADAIAKAVQSAAGAGHEGLVKCADLDSAVAMLRADMYRALWIQGVGIVAVVAAVRFLPVCGRSAAYRHCGSNRRPARALRPNRPPTSSLATFEPSLHFVDLVHALNDDAAGRGGYFVLEGAEAGADVDAPFDGFLDGLRVHVVCSVVASVGTGGGASLRDAICRPASGQPLPPVGVGRPPGAHRDRFL